MDIWTIILILVGGWFLFKIIIPSIQMTRNQMKDIGDASKYVKSDDAIVSNAVDKSRLNYLIKKYKKKGYSKSEAEAMAYEEHWRSRK